MFKNNTSSNNFVVRFSAICLSGVVLFFSLAEIFGQEKIKFAEPFRKCKVFGTNSGFSQTIASDNESNLIYSEDKYSLISVNLETNLENWKSQTVGKLDKIVISDKDSLFYISSSENEKQKMTYFLNSLSIKTGITNWQKKFVENVRLNQTENEDLIFLIKEDMFLLAIEKNTGKTLWANTMQDKILSAKSETDGQINILTKDKLLNFSIRSGELINDIKLNKNSVNNSLVRNSYLLLGYPTGEFIKVSAENDKNEVVWRIKTGGGITDLIEVKDEVLVTSLDNFLYLYSIDSGKLKWKRRVGGRINIKPLIYDNHAIVLNSAENSASIIELREGKVINQIRIEDNNNFSGPPIILGGYFIFQTFKGIYLFTNSNSECR